MPDHRRTASPLRQPVSLLRRRPAPCLAAMEAGARPPSPAAVHVTIVTAYTADYALGHVTAPVNRAYAARHGYGFVERILPPFDHAAAAAPPQGPDAPGPRRGPPPSHRATIDGRHPTWQKVALLVELLEGLLRHRTGRTACTVTGASDGTYTQSGGASDGIGNQSGGASDGIGNQSGGTGDGSGTQSGGAARTKAGARAGTSVSSSTAGNGDSGFCSGGSGSANRRGGGSTDSGRTSGPGHGPSRALPCGPETEWLLWVDADAAVVGQATPVDDLLRGLPPDTQLVVGEDLAPCCRVNAGVLLVRVSEWSARLWADVWEAEASRSFHRRRYHEQSALERQLACRREGLEAWVGPYYSYRGGPRAPKVFPHVCVLARAAFNTNRGDASGGGEGEGGAVPGAAEREELRCDFVFHAAGSPVVRGAADAQGRRRSKEVALRLMLAARGLTPAPAVATATDTPVGVSQR